MNKMHNWGKSQIWFPETVLSPSTLKELREAILKARNSRSKVRFAGSLHSFNPLCTTNNIQVRTDQLDKVLSVDVSNLTVKAEGGIKITKLLAVLASHGLTLPNQGYITDQSIAGAIATATHGSGKTGTLSSFVEEIELIDAQGDLHRLSPSSNPHLFSAAVVNLGCLGAIYSVTLKCIPLGKLHLSKVKGTLQTTLEELNDLLTNNEYFQFTLNPYGDETIVWRYQKTERSPSQGLYYKFRWLLLKLMAVSSFDLFPPPSWLIPSMIKLYMAASPLKSCIDYSYKLLSPADDGHYVEQEIAVPFQYFKEALAVVRQIIEKHSKQKNRVVAIIMLRFADPCQFGYLSPAIGRKTAYISLISFDREGYKELFQEVETSLYLFQGRPHWGKVHFLKSPRIAQLYGSNYDRFLEARKELDPEGMFLNQYLHDLFDVRDC